MFKKTYHSMGAAMTVGLIASTNSALAAPPAAPAAGANTFSSISTNIGTSIAGLPGLVSGMAYLFGTLIGVLGIMKIKDHVENPTQTPLKDGAIRLAAGGGLFALPIVYEAMFETVGTGNQTATTALNAVDVTVTAP